MRSFPPIVLGGILVALFFACERRVDPPPAPLRIGIETWAGYAFAYLAEEKGFFKRNGVTVDLVYANDSATSRKHFEKGELDGWFDVLPEAVIGHSKGVPARVVWVMDYSDSADVIVANASIASINDLAGKRIGIEGINTFSHMFALELLTKHGVPEEAIRFEIVRPMQVLDALKKGTIDAGHTWEPITSAAVASGYKILGKAGEVPGLITDVLFMSPAAIAGKPAQIKAALKSLAEAVAYAQAHPDESAAIMARHEKMSLAEFTGGLAGLHVVDLAENARIMRPTGDPDSLAVATGRIIEFFLDRGQLISRPKVEDLIEPRFVIELSHEK